MANIFHQKIARQILSIVFITGVYLVISYILIQEQSINLEQLFMSIPLFVTYGKVMTLNILFCFKTYPIMDAI